MAKKFVLHDQRPWEVENRPQNSNTISAYYSLKFEIKLSAGLRYVYSPAKEGFNRGP